MKYNRVYWWQGGTERGEWRETAVQAGEDAQDLALRMRRQGYVAHPGRSTVGAPEGAPSFKAEFDALLQFRAANLR